MGLVTSKMANMAIWPVFGGICNVQDGVGGVYMHKNILFLEFGYFATWRTHLQNYEFWGHILRPAHLISGKSKFIFPKIPGVLGEAATLVFVWC